MDLTATSKLQSSSDVGRGCPDLATWRARALSLAEPTTLLIEDAGAGIGLIQDLRRSGCHAIPVKSARDEIARMAIQAGKYKAGQVHFPENARWLATFEAELFAFPGSQHDDQVDPVLQALTDQR